MFFIWHFSECTLPQLVGNCSQQITRYYYDVQSGKCKQFVYSGCNGNLNNFELEDECNLRCVCSRPKDEGTGSSQMTRYFYNDNQKKCESFFYKGSAGNGNRFLTRPQCEKMCEPLKAKCKTRPNFGRRCDRKTPSTMYYYDIISGKCTQFPYQGCGGSKNKFPTLERCQESCNGRDIVTTTPQPNVCFFQPVAGPCSQTTIRYYYDFSIKRCLPFAYSGCGGNGNNFETEVACNATCGNRDSSTPENFAETTTTTTTMKTTTVTSRIPICNNDADRGNCRFNLRRYYFDRRSGQCKEFSWSGCGGNMNRFTSRELCTLTCTML